MAEYEIFGPGVVEVIHDVRMIVRQEHGWDEDQIHDSLIRYIIGPTTYFGSYRGYWSNNLPYKLAAQTCAAQTNCAVKMFRLVDKYALGKILPRNCCDLIGLALINHCKTHRGYAGHPERA